MHCINKFLMYDNLININNKNAILLSLDSSYQDKFNESKFIKLQLLDYLKTGVCKIRKFEKILLK
jgi:hypothetical protein